MKCIKPAETSAAPTVVRVSNEKAKAAVKSGFHVYAPKSEWKADGRKRS